MILYTDKIRERASELEKYPGYLPSLVSGEINLLNWHNFLKEKGLDEKVWEKIAISRRYTFDERINELMQWIKDNPEYSDFIDEEVSPEKFLIA